MSGIGSAMTAGAAIGRALTVPVQGGGAPRANIGETVPRAHPASVATAKARAMKRLDRMDPNPRLSITTDASD
jgi:hypothetical protein